MGTQLDDTSSIPARDIIFHRRDVSFLPGFPFARRRAGVPLGRWLALFDGAAGGGWDARCAHLALGVLG